MVNLAKPFRLTYAVTVSARNPLCSNLMKVWMRFHFGIFDKMCTTCFGPVDPLKTSLAANFNLEPSVGNVYCLGLYVPWYSRAAGTYVHKSH